MDASPKKAITPPLCAVVDVTSIMVLLVVTRGKESVVVAAVFLQAENAAIIMKEKKREINFRGRGFLIGKIIGVKLQLLYTGCKHYSNAIISLILLG